MSRAVATWARSPILIGGHQRSGTNLILSLLDGHPNLVVFGPGHLHLFSQNLERVSSVSGEARLDFVLDREIIRKLATGQKTNVENIDEYFDYDTFESHFREGIDDYSWDTIISHLFVSYDQALDLPKEAPVGWAENTPGNEHVFDISSAFFPNSKLIHMVRDPRDVWTSYKIAGKESNRGRTVWEFMRRWLKSAVAASHNRREYGDQYMVLDYNELVTRSQVVMSDVAEFLDIPFTETLLRPTKVGSSYTGNSQHTDEYAAISDDSVGRYRSHLTGSEIRLLDSVCLPIYESIVRKRRVSLPSTVAGPTDYARIVNPGLYRSQTNDVGAERYFQHFARFVYGTTRLESEIKRSNLDECANGDFGRG